MMRLFSTLVLVALIAGVALAAEGVERKPLAIDTDATLTAAPATGARTPAVLKTGALTWTMIDSTPNIYGQASLNAKPMYYDEDLNALVIIHRGMTTSQGGYAAGSGQCWYNLSTDDGATWPRISDLNAGTGNDYRYPSAAIQNGTGSSNLSDAIFVFAAPSIATGGWGTMAYGVDFPLGGAAPVAFRSGGADSALGSSAALWMDGPTSLWNMDDGIGTYHWDTQDFVTVNEGDPPPWLATTLWVSWGHMFGRTQGPYTYFGYSGSDVQDTTSPPGNDLNFLYSMSSDHGATWSNWNRPMPSYKDYGLGPNYFIDRVGTGVSNDLQVDVNQKVHFWGVAEDTTSGDPGDKMLVEVYETGSTWDIKTVATGLNSNTILAPFGLGQNSWGIQSAIDAAGEIMAVVWLNAATTAATDTIPDIWFSWRNIAGEWSTPMNLTESPTVPEAILHAAAQLKTEGSNQYTMFLNRSTDLRDDVVDSLDALAPSALLSAKHTFTATTSVRELPGVPDVYVLDQNYPNPFNPSTIINYSIPTAGFVTLKVYDLLGQEVATLVNENHQPGNYSIDFSATDLANGAYFYRITAGSFTGVKKMVLMK